MHGETFCAQLSTTLGATDHTYQTKKEPCGCDICDVVLVMVVLSYGGRTVLVLLSVCVDPVPFMMIHHVVFRSVCFCFGVGAFGAVVWFVTCVWCVVCSRKQERSLRTGITEKYSNQARWRENQAVSHAVATTRNF